MRRNPSFFPDFFGIRRHHSRHPDCFDTESLPWTPAPSRGCCSSSRPICVPPPPPPPPPCRPPMPPCGCNDSCDEPCLMLKPLASGRLDCCSKMTMLELPRCLPGRPPLKLTCATSRGVCAVSTEHAGPRPDPCDCCPNQLLLTVTIPMDLTFIDCHGCQHCAQGTIELCVPMTLRRCHSIPQGAQVHVKVNACLTEPVCITHDMRCVEVPLDIKLEAYIVCLSSGTTCPIQCDHAIPWYPQPCRPTRCDS